LLKAAERFLQAWMAAVLVAGQIEIAELLGEIDQ
jgi:hypothetical protein